MYYFNYVFVKQLSDIKYTPIIVKPTLSSLSRILFIFPNWNSAPIKQ